MKAHLFRRAAALLLLATPGFTARLDAARLEPETEAAWRRYVHDVETRRERERAAAATPPPAGQVVVSPAGKNGTDGSIDVPSGLIHHWRGSVLIQGVTLDDVLGHLRRAPRQSDVLASRILEDRGDAIRVFLKLTRKEIITVTYNTEHLVEIRRDGDGRASSRSVATKIAELDEPGTPREREKPAGEDLGLLWRLQAYWRYEQVPGGVVVECESLSLSRAIPMLLKPIASGMVDGVARESMTRTLETMRVQLQERGRLHGRGGAYGRLGHSPQSVPYFYGIHRRMSEGLFPTADFPAVDSPLGTTLLRSLRVF